MLYENPLIVCDWSHVVDSRVFMREYDPKRIILYKEEDRRKKESGELLDFLEPLSQPGTTNLPISIH